MSPLRLVDTHLRRSRFLSLVLAIATAISAVGAFIAFRTATPSVPALETGGQLALFIENCDSVKYELTVDLDEVSKTGTLNIDTRATCNIVGSQTVRWVMAMAGPLSHATRALAGSSDPHQSNELHPVNIRRVESISMDEGKWPFTEIPVTVVAGTNDTDAGGGLSLKLSIESASVGRREGANIAIAVPSVSADGFYFDKEFEVPVALFDEANNTSEAVNVEVPKIESVSFDAGQLNTAERTEFSSLPLGNPASIRWQLDEGRGVSALIVDTNRRQLEERLLFWAGILGGVAVTLLVWLAEIRLEARGALPRESTEDP